MLHYIQTNTNAFYPLTPSYCALTRLNVFPSPSLILRFLSKNSPFFQRIIAFSSLCVSLFLSLSLALSLSLPTLFTVQPEIIFIGEAAQMLPPSKKHPKMTDVYPLQCTILRGSVQYCDV